MFTHKMCESCSINIQLSKRLPSPRFFKAVWKNAYCHFSLSIDSPIRICGHYWLSLIKCHSLYTVHSAFEYCSSFLALPCMFNIAGGVVKNIFTRVVPVKWLQSTETVCHSSYSNVDDFYMHFNWVSVVVFLKV